jgi:hypothetical protein
VHPHVVSFMRADRRNFVRPEDVLRADARVTVNAGPGDASRRGPSSMWRSIARHATAATATKAVGRRGMLSSILSSNDQCEKGRPFLLLMP